MLPYTFRLNKEHDIKKTLASKKSSGSRLITCKFSRNDLQHSRIGFIVSNKVSKLATKRNKLKRQMRASVEKHLAEIKNGYDIIFIAKPTLLDKEYSIVEKEIIKCLERIS